METPNELVDGGDSQCAAVGNVLVRRIKALCLFTESKLPGEEGGLVIYN